MNKLLITTALLVLCLVGVHRETRIRERVRELERIPRVDPAELARLNHELEDVERLLAATREQVEADEDGRIRDARLAELEQCIGVTDVEVAAQAERLRLWSATWAGHDPAELRERLRALRRARLEDREQLIALSEAADSARVDLDRIEVLDQSLASLLTARDGERMWHELIGPVVQIAGEITVGSGVLLASQPVEDGKFRTHLLTSWHVVRDIYGGIDRVDEPIEVKLYLDNGTTVFESATMVAYEVEIDIALLQLSTDEPVRNGARIASRERLDSIQVFDNVYAVGCPLGNDPIPTAGEIADVRHSIDGERYWMISAPTYIGNSGGGIFDAQTHELLGIFSKIYTHGGARSTIVPHMGLVTPLQTVYDWLDSVDYALLEVPAGGTTLPGVGVQAARAELGSD